MNNLTDKDKKTIKKYYPTEGKKVLSRLETKITEKELYRYAKNNGIKYINKSCWTAKQIFIFNTYYTKDPGLVAKLTGKTPHACWNYAQKHHKSKKTPRWSNFEKKLLADKNITELLKTKTKSAIKARKWRIKKGIIKEELTKGEKHIHIFKHIGNCINEECRKKYNVHSLCVFRCECSEVRVSPAEYNYNKDSLSKIKNICNMIKNKYNNLSLENISKDLFVPDYKDFTETPKFNIEYFYPRNKFTLKF